MKNRTKQDRPPKWMDKLLEWFCSPFFLDEVQGDLHETYRIRVGRYGKRVAKAHYLLEVMKFFKPSIIRGEKRNVSSANRPFKRASNRRALFGNSVKTAYRNMIRNSTYSAINILGLAIGIACCLIISLYVIDELSYDKFFENSKDIYRVGRTNPSLGMASKAAVTPLPLAPILVEDYAEVESATRMHKLFWHPEMTIKAGNSSFVETNMFLVDEHFFKVFSFQFLEGNPETALKVKNQVVLTDKTARKYFGDEPALHKTIDLDFGRKLVVSGVIKDIPENSHMNFDLLGHLRFMNYVSTAMDENSWTLPYVYTYFKLNSLVLPDQLEAKFPALVKKHADDQLSRRYGAGYNYDLFLQPLEDIHLKSNLSREQQVNSSTEFVYVLISIVFFILLISCVNFVNLSTARSAERAKEVGIRKVMGSLRSDLLRQFLTESIIVSLTALLISILMVAGVLPTFNSIVDKELSVESLMNPMVVPGMIALSVGIGLLAGWYPAWVISSLKTTTVLKGTFKTSSRGIWLRNGLVIFQFIVSIVLISGSLIIDDQMKFINNKSLGYNRENTLLIKHPLSLGQQEVLMNVEPAMMGTAVIANANQKIQLFKEALQQIPEIESAGGMFNLISNVESGTTFKAEDSEVGSFSAGLFTIDNDLVEAIGMKVVKGRSFDRNFDESKSAMINETAAKLLGWEDPIGQEISTDDDGPPLNLKIVGVVGDFHFQSLRTPMRPLIILNGLKSPTYFPTALAVRINSEDLFQTVAEIEQVWTEFAPNESMLWSFLDDDLSEMYNKEETSARILQGFTGLAIFIACIGLLGLAAYITRQRTKEIGVRKVLGADIMGIMMLLSKRFGQLILLSFIIAIPITYLLANQWLNEFAYRVGVNWVLILGAGLCTLVLALVTISYETFKIAKVNPIKSLRSE